MRRLAPSRRWVRAIAVVGVAVMLLSGSAARADVPPRPAAPAASHRLIRLGPQALISVDDQGRVSMADEPPPESSRYQVLTGLLAMLSVPTWILIQGPDQLGFGGNGVNLVPATPARTSAR